MHEREREGLVGWSSALTSKPSSVQYMCMTSLSVSCTDGVNVQTNANLSDANTVEKLDDFVGASAKKKKKK
ncbi:hypothetical protein Peur_040225 [Populus x canadensis]